MTVKELIEKLKEMPQDTELPIKEENITGINQDFNKGLLVGMVISGLISLNNSKNCDVPSFQQPKNPFSNMHGDYEKYIFGNVFTESNREAYMDRFVDR